MLVLLIDWKGIPHILFASQSGLLIDLREILLLEVPVTYTYLAIIGYIYIFEEIYTGNTIYLLHFLVCSSLCNH